MRARPRPALWGRALASAVLATALSLQIGPLAGTGARHAIAMHGEPALPADFPHFPYVNPAAPQGGRLVLGVLGTFDSLNPFVVRGLALSQIRGYVVESLLTRNYNEPFHVARFAARIDRNRRRAQLRDFHLDPRARFSDGAPVTAQDVLFSWAALRDKGRPNHRTYYAKVAQAQAIGERGVRFDFADGGDRELPLILGLMPVLAQHATNEATFEETKISHGGRGTHVVARFVPANASRCDESNFWAATSPSIAASGTSRRCASTTIATPTLISRASRSLYDMRVEGDPGVGSRPTTFRPCAAAASSRTCADRPAPPHVRLRLQYAPRAVQRHRVREAIGYCSISSGSITISSSTNIAVRRATLRFGALRAWPSSRSDRARLAGAVPAGRPRRHHGGTMVASGDRRQRARPRAAQALAKSSTCCSVVFHEHIQRTSFFSSSQV